LLICAAAPAAAQDYPNKTIRFIVPYPAGGLVDALARLIADNLSKDFGQTVVVENRPGGATMIGTQAVVTAPADGYTLLLGNTNISINPGLNKKLPYDADKDLTAVALVNLVPTLFLVHPDVPVHSIKELIAYAKANPGKMNYAHGGHGSFPHLAVELFKGLAKVEITPVPFTGAAPALTAVLGKHVELIDNDIPTALPYVKDGKLRALAITSDTRMKTFPDVPTMVEAGVPGYEAVAWQGVFVPSATPRPVVDKLNKAIIKALGAPELRDIFAKQGIEGIPPWTPEQFTAFLQKENVRWKKAIEAAGIKPE
jgi:tripartite-type tricarboxylate transporter receptor subunit TctC